MYESLCLFYHMIHMEYSYINLNVLLRLETTQPTHSGAIIAIWKTAVPIVSDSRAFYRFFWASRPCGPARWLELLLIKAGDVETNPGPTTTRK